MAQLTSRHLTGIPVIISFILLAGFGGRHLGAATSYNAGAGTGTAGNILSWASIVVGFSRELLCGFVMLFIVTEPFFDSILVRMRGRLQHL